MDETPPPRTVIPGSRSPHPDSPRPQSSLPHCAAPYVRNPSFAPGCAAGSWLRRRRDGGLPSQPRIVGIILILIGLFFYAEHSCPPSVGPYSGGHPHRIGVYILLRVGGRERRAHHLGIVLVGLGALFLQPDWAGWSGASPLSVAVVAPDLVLAGIGLLLGIARPPSRSC